MKSQSISRRDALRRIGSAVMGGVAASSGLLSMVACEHVAKKRIILYFTGTGNSLYVARQLAGDNAELLSIPQMVRQGRYDFKADEIGIVYPIYGHMPPYMVRQFIKRAKLDADYKFAVLTYGARKCSAVEIWDDISARAGNKFDYISTIVMVDNWLPNFDMNEQVKIDKHIPQNIDRIRGDIAVRRNWYEPVSDQEREQHQGFMDYSGLNPEVGFLMRSEKCFVVTDACIGCGICTNVCPRGNYGFDAMMAKPKGDCEFCFACIQNCPQRAIQFAKSEDGSFPDGSEKNPQARYRNEHISLMDIKMANNQLVNE